MKRAYIVLITGVWVAILPYLGFPHIWKNVLMSFSGLGLIFFSYILYRESEVTKKEEEAFDNFSENKFEGVEKI